MHTNVFYGDNQGSCVGHSSMITNDRSNPMRLSDGIGTNDDYIPALALLASRIDTSLEHGLSSTCSLCRDYLRLTSCWLLNLLATRMSRRYFDQLSYLTNAALLAAGA